MKYYIVQEDGTTYKTDDEYTMEYHLGDDMTVIINNEDNTVRYPNNANWVHIDDVLSLAEEVESEDE